MSSRPINSPPPTVVRTRSELRRVRAEWTADRIGVVMTMGALHAGHAELLRAARERCDRVIATLFVNPLQFGAQEDFTRYPSTFDADLELCHQAGVDLLFAPESAELYPGGAGQLRVSAGPLGELLEGAARPGHFDGVLTVVSKLLHLTAPTFAFFGEKDAQQLLLIRRLVQDLDFPVRIIGVPTIREADGLARSSRNRYLSASERASALAISRALFAAAEADNPAAIRARAHAILAAEPGLSLDYLALVDPETLTEIGADFQGPALLAAAARVGSTRLIDNIAVHLPRSTSIIARPEPGHSHD
jgi:pantoate--beta-alanine ligase